MRRIICIPAAAPGTSAMRRHVRTYAYNTHVHIRDCACAFHLHSHLGRDAPPSVTQIMCAARQGQRQRRDAPYRDAACAPHRGSWVKVVHVCTLTVFFLVFVFSAVILLTVVASLHRADVFRVRIGVHCKEFGVNSCSNGAYFSIILGRARALFETEVSATTFRFRNSTVDQS